MDIYSPVVLSEASIKKFKPTRLYIKELAGVKYFGKSTVQNVEKYNGSGVIWRKRIKKYGKENIKTLWISDWFYDPHEIQKVALDFSRNNKIVESELWANLWPENGINGGKTRCVSANKGKMIAIDNQRNTFLIDKNSTLVESGEVRSVNKGTIGVIDLVTGKSKRISVEDFRDNPDKFKTLTKGKRRKSDDPPHGLIGKITAKDSFGKTIKVYVTDERLITGELRAFMKGKVNVIDNNGNSFSVSIDDPKYISGEYKFSGGPKPGFKQEIVTCYHCGKTGGKSNITRHHFDRCKFKM